MAMPARVERLLRPFEALIERMLTVGIVSFGIILAAQTFLALIPLLMATIAFLPADTAASVQQLMRDRLGLSGTSDSVVSQLVKSRGDLRGGLTVFGAIVVLASATSFTRTLQRLYETAWGVPRLGLRGSLRGLMWLVGVVAYVFVFGLAIRFAGSGPTGTVLRTLLVTTGSVMLWWWTPYVLMAGRVSARALLPSGLLTAGALIVVGAIGSIYLPRSVRGNERRFGTIGVVFAIESWLVVVSCVLVGAAIVAAVAAQIDGPIGRLCRGTADPEGWRRAKGRLTSVTGET